MKIAITGGSGFIGNYLINKLASDHQLIVLGRKKREPLSTPIEKLISYHQTDYSVDTLTNIFATLEPDAVVHLAAIRPSNNANNSTFISNLTIANNLFESCFRTNINNIVNLSSISIYSPANPLPWKEDQHPEPFNHYGLSKLWIEEAANFYNARGLSIKSLRVAQVIGIGEREGFLLQNYLNDALSGKALKVYGQGKGKRQYVHVKDVVKAIEHALSLPQIKGTFNIGMEQNYSFSELAKTINSVFGNNSPIEYLKDKPADENIYFMDITKANNVLAWHPIYSTLQDIYQNIYIMLNN